MPSVRNVWKECCGVTVGSYFPGVTRAYRRVAVLADWDILLCSQDVRRAVSLARSSYFFFFSFSSRKLSWPFKTKFWFKVYVLLHIGADITVLCKGTGTVHP